MFYSVRESGYRTGTIAGWPMQKHPWCNKLKTEKVDLYRTVLQTYKKPFLQGADQRIPNPKRKLVHFRSEARRVRSPLDVPQNEGQRINIVHYIGIAADEPLRIAKHLPKKDKVLPLVQIGWDEELCGLEAKYMDMLSPTYTDGQMRDGCWFCHNQGVNQLRRLRKMYPDLWAKLMKLDLDSPVTFHADGHTVHDFDRRFALEDDGLVDPSEPWRWAMLDEELNLRWF